MVRGFPFGLPLIRDLDMDQLGLQIKPTRFCGHNLRESKSCVQGRKERKAQLLVPTAVQQPFRVDE